MVPAVVRNLDSCAPSGLNKVILRTNLNFRVIDENCTHFAHAPLARVECRHSLLMEMCLTFADLCSCELSRERKSTLLCVAFDGAKVDFG